MMMGYCDLQRVVERVTSRTASFTEVWAARNVLALKEAALRFRLASHKLPIALAALCLCGWLCGTATAQLRSGRTTRSLYVDETPMRSPNTRPAVVQASSGQYSTGQRSPGGNRSASVVPASYDDSYSEAYSDSYSGTESAPCDSCGDTSFTSAAGTEPYYESDGYAGCGRLGCENPGCSSCGGYSDLAPTCTSMSCSPGNGPLLSLLRRVSVRAEVPLFWRRAMGPPALVTTSSTGTGALGDPNTQTLLGGVDKLDQRTHAGLRLTFSTWLSADQRYALMFRYWNAGNQDDTFNFSSNQFPILARPFLNTSGTTAAQDSQLVAFSGDTIGNVSVTTESKLDGLELSLKRMIYQDRFTRVDWLYGYQHVSIDESLSIFSSTTGTVAPLDGNTISVRDTFRTANDFNGVAYGLMGSRQINCWKMETLFRLGLGNLRRKVNINGSTTTTAGGASQSTSQGLLARNTNDHPLVDDTFVVVPEVGINLACQLRPGLDFNVGYNYMMVPKVAQASQQINSNLAVNLSDPLVGSLDPSLRLNERKYWINSLGLGLQLRY